MTLVIEGGAPQLTLKSSDDRHRAGRHHHRGPDGQHQEPAGEGGKRAGFQPLQPLRRQGSRASAPDDADDAKTGQQRAPHGTGGNPSQDSDP